jgi:hypothetical protein
MNNDRREAIKKTAWLMGGALSAPTLLGMLQGCTPEPQPNWVPTFFTMEQAETVMEIVDTTIPTTANAPGAKELGIPAFVETMVNTVYTIKEKTTFMNGLDAFGKECVEKMGDPFSQLDPNKKLSFLMQKNKEMQDKYREIEYDDTIAGKEYPFYWRIKELTLLGYFTTEVGATKVLQHKLVPGQYQGCITLQEAGGRTWA